MKFSNFFTDVIRPVYDQAEIAFLHYALLRIGQEPLRGGMFIACLDTITILNE